MSKKGYFNHRWTTDLKDLSPRKRKAPEWVVEKELLKNHFKKSKKAPEKWLDVLEREGRMTRKTVNSLLSYSWGLNHPETREVTFSTFELCTTYAPFLANVILPKVQ